MDGKPSLKGAWLGHVYHLNIGGHQPYIWNDWSSQVLSSLVDGQCDKLVMVVGHQFMTLTVDICVQHGGSEAPRRAVCQRQRRLVLIASLLVSVRSIALSVCLSVCLFVCRLPRLKNHTPTFHQILYTCYLWPWLHRSLTAIQYVMYFRFCGWRHVFTQWGEWARIKDEYVLSS